MRPGSCEEACFPPNDSTLANVGNFSRPSVFLKNIGSIKKKALLISSIFIPSFFKTSRTHQVVKQRERGKDKGTNFYEEKCYLHWSSRSLKIKDHLILHEKLLKPRSLPFFTKSVSSKHKCSEIYDRCLHIERLISDLIHGESFQWFCMISTWLRL